MDLFSMHSIQKRTYFCALDTFSEIGDIQSEIQDLNLIVNMNNNCWSNSNCWLWFIRPRLLTVYTGAQLCVSTNLWFTDKLPSPSGPVNTTQPLSANAHWDGRKVGNIVFFSNYFKNFIIGQLQHFLDDSYIS